jgi:hypothetical protein
MAAAKPGDQERRGPQVEVSDSRVSITLEFLISSSTMRATMRLSTPLCREGIACARQSGEVPASVLKRISPKVAERIIV